MAKKLRRFRLKSGGHSDQTWVPVEKEDTNVVRVVERKDPFTGEMVPYRLVRNSYEVGDIVEYDGDLVKLFGVNAAGIAKFEEVLEDGQAVPQSSINLKLLKKMTVEKLKEYAAEEEIDIEGLNLKAEIIEVIEAIYEPEPDLEPEPV